MHFNTQYFSCLSIIFIRIYMNIYKKIRKGTQKTGVEEGFVWMWLQSKKSLKPEFQELDTSPKCVGTC